MSIDLDRRMATVVQAAGVLLPIPPEGQPRPLKDESLSYFFYNFGELYWPEHMWEVASCFAARIAGLQLHKKVDFIYGPPYKGIGLAHLISVALLLNHGVHLPICYSRKEIKGHGEGGVMVGVPIEPGMRGLVIDDVVTSGLAKLESKEIIESQRGFLAAVLVGIDRTPDGVLDALRESLCAEVYSVTTHKALIVNFDVPDYATF